MTNFVVTEMIESAYLGRKRMKKNIFMLFKDSDRIGFKSQ